jgi:NADPH:quinone reductase-like Zn-dependent oxidoreductase
MITIDRSLVETNYSAEPMICNRRCRVRALLWDGFDSQPSVQEVDVPEPGAGDVLVRVLAASINPVDLAAAAGAFKGVFEHVFPVTLGRDFAGVVEAIGPDVARFSPGDEVFGFLHIADPAVHAGSFADYVVVREGSALASMPADLPFVDVATLPLSGTAALMSVDAVDPQPGQRVLICGATGGVGRYAVQLVSARGASVIATGLSGDEAELRELGANEIVDYTADVSVTVTRAHPGGIDALIYLLQPPHDFPRLAALVRSGGRVATTVHAADVEQLAAAGVTATNVVAAPDPERIAHLGELARSGSLTTRIERTFTLEQIPEGFAHIASGRARGKLAVAIARHHERIGRRQVVRPVEAVPKASEDPQIE